MLRKECFKDLNAPRKPDRGPYSRPALQWNPSSLPKGTRTDSLSQENWLRRFAGVRPRTNKEESKPTQVRWHWLCDLSDLLLGLGPHAWRRCAAYQASDLLPHLATSLRVCFNLIHDCWWWGYHLNEAYNWHYKPLLELNHWHRTRRGDFPTRNARYYR